MLVWACSPIRDPQLQAESALQNLSDLVDKADSLGEGYSQETWEDTDSLFSHYLAECSKDDGAYLTEESKKELGRQAGRYATIRVRKGTEIIEEKLREAGLWVEGFFEGIKEELEEVK